MSKLDINKLNFKFNDIIEKYNNKNALIVALIALDILQDYHNGGIFTIWYDNLTLDKFINIINASYNDILSSNNNEFIKIFKMPIEYTFEDNKIHILSNIKKSTYEAIENVLYWRLSDILDALEL